MAQNKDTGTIGLRKQLKEQQHPTSKKETQLIIHSNSTMHSEGQRKIKNRVE